MLKLLKNALLILILIHLSLAGFGQIPKKVEKLNDIGLKQLEAKEYDQAIATFTESINLHPGKEAHYYRAIAYYNLQVMDEFMPEYCKDMQQASYHSYKNSRQLLNSECFIIDTVYVDINNEKSDSSKYEYMKVSRTNKQNGEFQLSVYNRDPKIIFGYHVVDNDTIYHALPGKMPEYPGGEEAMVAYLAKNIKYPVFARKNGISGNVFITFVVDETGEVKNVKMLRGIGGGCDEEAVRVVNLMPSWSPGYYNNRAVPVQYNLPIRFSLRR